MPNKFYIELDIYKGSNLSPSETIVKFLKEDQGFSFREISKILERDERNIWTLYNRVRKKNEK